MATEAMTIVELEQCVADLRSRLPRHSVPAAMLLELEELEDELARRAESGKSRAES